MDGWGFASFKVIIGFHREGRKGSHAGSEPSLTWSKINSGTTYPSFDIGLQRSAVTVTAVTATIAYSERFGNPQLAFHVVKNERLE